MKLSITKVLATAVIGVFILAFLPYLLGTFIKPTTIMVGTTPVQLTSGIFYNEYFFSVLGFSCLTYQLLSGPLGYAGNSVVYVMYSEINQQWIYTSLALAIFLGLIAALTSRNLIDSTLGIVLSYVTSSALQLYLAETLLLDLNIDLVTRTSAYNAILAFLASSNLIYLVSSTVVSYAIIRYVFPPKVVSLQEKKVVLTPETVILAPQKEEQKLEAKPSEVTPKEELKPQVSEKVFETTTEAKEEVPQEITLEAPKEPERVIEVPEKAVEIKEEEKKEQQPLEIGAEEVKQVEPVEESLSEKKGVEVEEVIELPEDLFKPITPPPREVEMPSKEEQVTPTESQYFAPTEEETKVKEIFPEKEEQIQPSEIKVEEKREPYLIISELEKALVSLQEKKYSGKFEDKLKVSLYCNICGHKLIWNKENERYECPICGSIQ